MIKVLIVLAVIQLVLAGCGIHKTPVTQENIKVYHQHLAKSNSQPWSSPPKVRGYKAEYVTNYFNSILPHTFQLEYDSTPVTQPHTHEEGIIKISKLSQREWVLTPQYKNNDKIYGVTHWHDLPGEGRVSAIIYMNPEDHNCNLRAMLAHEMGHALGFNGHIEVFSDSVMSLRCNGKYGLSDLEKHLLYHIYQNPHKHIKH